MIMQAAMVCFITFFSPFSLAAIAASVFSLWAHRRDLCGMEMKKSTSSRLQKDKHCVNFAVGNRSYLVGNSTYWLLFETLSHVTLI